jgi:hypothetical protein
MGIQNIKDKIVLHKNLKIDVLSTYWNLTDSEKEYLFNDILKTRMSICPIHMLDLTTQIREVLK